MRTLHRRWCLYRRIEESFPWRFQSEVILSVFYDGVFLFLHRLIRVVCRSARISNQAISTQIDTCRTKVDFETLRSDVRAQRGELKTLQKTLWAVIAFVAVFVVLYYPAMLNT